MHFSRSKYVGFYPAEPVKVCGILNRKSGQIMWDWTNIPTHAEITGKEEIFEVFKLLKQWRDELQSNAPVFLTSNWTEVNNV